MNTFRIIGRKFSTERKFYDWDKSHTYFTYDIIETKEFEPMQFESLDDAEMWLLVNEPEYYFGSNIIGDANNFSMVAVPDYYEMTLGTSDRDAIIQNEIRNLERRMK